MSERVTDAKVRRPRSPRGEGDRLRPEILDATERLLIETGSEDAVSIRGVADAIGVTPPAIYRHFADKTTLLFEVCGLWFARMDRSILEASRGLDDPVEVLRVRAHAYVRFGLDNPEHYRIMFMGRSAPTPEQYGDEMIVGSDAFAHLVEGVQSGIDAGIFRTELTDAYELALTFWAAIHGVTSLYVSKPYMPGPPAEQRLEQMLDVVFRGALRRH